MQLEKLLGDLLEPSGCNLLLSDSRGLMRPQVLILG